MDLAVLPGSNVAGTDLSRPHANELHRAGSLGLRLHVGLGDQQVPPISDHHFALHFSHRVHVLRLLPDRPGPLGEKYTRQ